MKNSLLKVILFTLAACFIFGNAHAQGWEKTYSRGIGKVIKQTQDKEFLVASDSSVLRIDADGKVSWSVKYNFIINDIELTPDGGFMIAGEDTSRAALVKCNSHGNISWEKLYGNTKPSSFNDIQTTSDGGYILGGKDNITTVCWHDSTHNSYGNHNPSYHCFIVKINATGDTLWTKSFVDPLTNVSDTLEYGSTFAAIEANKILEKNGGYLVFMERDLCTYYYNPSGGTTYSLWPENYLLQVDVSGDTLWSNHNTCKPYNIIDCPDGNMAILTYKDFAKINSAGDTLWTKVFGSSPYDYASSIAVTSDNGFILAGNSNDTTNTNIWYSDLMIIRTDSSGNLLWFKKYGNGNNDDEEGYDVIQSSDGGYLAVGSKGPWREEYIYIIKTDSIGNTITNIISGNVYHDFNGNCKKDSGETGLSNWIIKLDPGDRYTSTDSNGFYSFLADSGVYTVSIAKHPPYWTAVCPTLPDTHVVYFASNNFLVSDSNDFATSITTLCPHLFVDISTWVLRRCLKNIYSVNYCNNGTDTAFNAFVEITFDPLITVLNSTLPWSKQSGNTFTFELGNLSPGQCENFQITDSVSCDATLNSTLCAEAIIYPDTICTPVDSAWDRSSIFITGKCMGDSLACFIIRNNGLNMTEPSQYRIFVNNVLVLTQNFQLNTGDSLVVCYPANGNTIRLEADQRPGHPGYSHPKKIIEGCGTPSVLGNVTTVAQDDADDNKDIDCHSIRGSFDPNEKSVQPEGITSGKYISSSDELTYQINFQNTGNDTAFLVVIKDTLSGYLDLATVKSGASSHPYSFRIYGSGILEWTFSNIMLPDSNINKPASHGFVTFTVKQKANITQGSVIHNSAAIYFDYNAPVITNKVWNMVYDTTLTTAIGKPVIFDNKTDIRVYPNPFSVSTTVEIKSSTLNPKSQINFVMVDLLGREVKKLQFLNYKLKVERGDLTGGMYFYKVESESEVIGAGKMIID